MYRLILLFKTLSDLDMSIPKVTLGSEAVISFFSFLLKHLFLFYFMVLEIESRAFSLHYIHGSVMNDMRQEPLDRLL